MEQQLSMEQLKKIKNQKLERLAKQITENLENTIRKASISNKNIDAAITAWNISMLAELHWKIEDVGQTAGELLLGLVTAVDELKLKVTELERKVSLYSGSRSE